MTIGKLLKEFPFLIISWDDSCQSLVTEWKGGFVNKEKYIEGMNAALKLFVELKCKKVLSNTKEAGVLGVDTQKWVKEDFFPRFIAAGVRYFATVVPSDSLAQMSIKALSSTAQGGLKTNSFDNVEAAQKWLREQKV